MAVALIFFLVLSVCIGSVSIPVSEILKSYGDWKLGGTTGSILWEIRLPRALAAVLLGGALALSGYLLQTFFHNPIAGPFVLGISSGSKLAVALVLVFSMGRAFAVSSFMLILAAFVGAFFSMGFVLLMAQKVTGWRCWS